MKKLENPLEMAGCYTLDLYCDYENSDHKYEEFPHIYTAELGSRCRKDAEHDGWILHRNGTATCPKCSKRLAEKG